MILFIENSIIWIELMMDIHYENFLLNLILYEDNNHVNIESNERLSPL
jgi:hypothetical protein